MNQKTGRREHNMILFQLITHVHELETARLNTEHFKQDVFSNSFHGRPAMNRKTLLTLSTGLLVGFVSGLVSVQHIIPMLTAQEKKRQKPQDPVVRELHNIEAAISDRNSPVVEELEEMSDELEEIAEMKRTLEKIERNMD